MERVLSFMKIELQLLSLILKSKLSWVKLLLPSSPVCACTGGRKDARSSVGSLLPQRDWKEGTRFSYAQRASYCWTRKQCMRGWRGSFFETQSQIHQSQLKQHIVMKEMFYLGIRGHKCKTPTPKRRSYFNWGRKQISQTTVCEV